MAEGEREEVPEVKEPGSDEKDKVNPIKKSEQELMSRYPQGLQPRQKSVAQRKISSGGVQYFDSGDYNAASRKDKQRIAGLPGRPAMNPAMARLQGRPPSKLTSAGPPPRSGLANVTRSEQ